MDLFPASPTAPLFAHTAVQAQEHAVEHVSFLVPIYSAMERAPIPLRPAVKSCPTKDHKTPAS